MNKRGIVFTFIAVILLSILILMFLIQSNKKTELEITKSSVQTTTLNSFVKSLKTEYIPRAIEVSSNQAILALLDYMEKNQRFLLNSEIDIINSTLTGHDPEGNELGMMLYYEDEELIDYTIHSALDEVKDLAEQTQINFSFDPYNLNISQKDSWTLEVIIYNFEFTVASLDGKTRWEDTINISTELSITNYRDPIILLNESLNITIEKADTTTYPSMDGNIDKIVNQTENHTFNTNPDAPSFLQRLEYDLTLNPEGYGIEYIVNPIFNDNSAGYILVDHKYWNKDSNGRCSGVVPGTGLPNFYLDRSHLLNVYGFSPGDINSWCPLPPPPP